MNLKVKDLTPTVQDGSHGWLVYPEWWKPMNPGQGDNVPDPQAGIVLAKAVGSLLYYGISGSWYDDREGHTLESDLTFDPPPAWGMDPWFLHGQFSPIPEHGLLDYDEFRVVGVMNFDRWGNAVLPFPGQFYPDPYDDPIMDMGWVPLIHKHKDGKLSMVVLTVPYGVVDEHVPDP